MPTRVKPKTQGELDVIYSLQWEYDGLNPPGTLGREDRPSRTGPGDTAATLAAELEIPIAQVWKALAMIPVAKAKEGTLTPQQADEWQQHSRYAISRRGEALPLTNADHAIVVDLVAGLSIRKAAAKHGVKKGRVETILAKAKAQGLITNKEKLP
jgi:hypothetical protein